ncbi:MULTISPECIES: bactofilin family protein [unclassified Butyrivibrio]|jgi:cytoskeletal protein CcmA (bactofilin family)|uniref:bactofilin family protein n=1 Tax=unclassified Butyrivibrio TaxID=2639466 RepID=UPI0003B73655|nr:MULTISPECIES: polymer-forming cytoskeletal protein [unclassified Butyrivibrio]MDC7294900.1 polymer-forming cytoskeletal protein [Butyrivibrio sp. DSM 10294]
MFGKKETTFDASLEQVGTIIGQGAVLDGPLTTKDSTRIDGTVKGNVTISGALIVGQEAKIVGTVSAQNVYIAGEVNGNISAPQGKIEISDTGKVYGDVTCKGIIIDENAVFAGKCDMTGLDKTSADIAKERAAADKAASAESSAADNAGADTSDKKDGDKHDKKGKNK